MKRRATITMSIVRGTKIVTKVIEVLHHDFEYTQKIAAFLVLGCYSVV